MFVVAPVVVAPVVVAPVVVAPVVDIASDAFVHAAPVAVAVAVEPWAPVESAAAVDFVVAVHFYLLLRTY